jgi:hypothetical protein
MINICFRNTPELVIKVKVFPWHAMQTQRGSSGELYSFFNLGVKCGRLVKVNPRPLYPCESLLISFVQEVVWGPAPVWRDVGKWRSFVTTGLRNPNRPARRRLQTVYFISTLVSVTKCLKQPLEIRVSMLKETRTWGTIIPGTKLLQGRHVKK